MDAKNVVGKTFRFINVSDWLDPDNCVRLYKCNNCTNIIRTKGKISKDESVLIFRHMNYMR